MKKTKFGESITKKELDQTMSEILVTSTSRKKKAISYFPRTLPATMVSVESNTELGVKVEKFLDKIAKIKLSNYADKKFLTKYITTAVNQAMGILSENNHQGELNDVIDKVNGYWSRRCSNPNSMFSIEKTQHADIHVGENNGPKHP